MHTMCNQIPTQLINLSNFLLDIFQKLLSIMLSENVDTYIAGIMGVPVDWEVVTPLLASPAGLDEDDPWWQK